jgi:hypothetical protein
MLLVQLGINSTRDVWKFCQIGLAPAARQFWQNFQTSLVLLIPNCTRHRMITYTYTRHRGSRIDASELSPLWSPDCKTAGPQSLLFLVKRGINKKTNLKSV